MTGASVTNKGLSGNFIVQTWIFDLIVTGIYYESGKEPPPEGPPKLHLLIESNEEYRVSTFQCALLGVVN
jgi:ATP-dependent RNA helicase DDX46/PRP5